MVAYSHVLSYKRRLYLENYRLINDKCATDEILKAETLTCISVVDPPSIIMRTYTYGSLVYSTMMIHRADDTRPL